MSDKPIPLRDAPEPWVDIARRQLRSGFIISTVGYVLVVAVIGWTLVAMEREASRARADLANVTAELADARGQLSSARAQLAQTQQAATQAQTTLTDLRKQYDSVAAAKEAAERDLAASRQQVSELEQQLHQIYDFKPYVVPINEVDEKVAYGEIGEQGFRIIQQALQDEHRKLPFNGANTRDLGFNSPGYANYLLRLTAHPPLEQLHPRIGEPKNGDIITYQGGYTMFYFRVQGKTFVIGMTPEGILSLNPQFGHQTGVLAVLSP
jgi:hypothetical protein